MVDRRDKDNPDVMVIVGRVVRLDGVPHTVIGVVGTEQGWPADGDVWVPFRWGGVVPDWALGD